MAAYDVVGIGNAIVDVIARCDDAFLAANSLAKGAMTLVDAERALNLYAKMGPGTEMSGGSAANTMAGIATLGGKVAYIGKVRDDELGKVFQHDIRAAGVSYKVPLTPEGAPTARCLILVTPDAQRTMNTFLGISSELGPEDIDASVITKAKVIYLEGYLFDPPRAKEAFRRAARLARDAGRKVALTLSDAFCVDRHRDDFLDLLAGSVDILFANEAEIAALYRGDDFDSAVRAVRGQCDLAILTRSEKGSVVVSGDATYEVKAERVDRVVDTTGAGDLYAAGFLYGLTNGYDLPRAGKVGAIAAAEIISHVGARPAVRLDALVRSRLG
jgi:sugar/nucleoside kinase (ribokinase family)